MRSASDKGETCFELFLTLTTTLIDATLDWLTYTNPSRLPLTNRCSRTASAEVTRKTRAIHLTSFREAKVLNFACRATAPGGWPL